ncbi:hypothetical protein [Lactiplantibacillus plajomi]|uniref:Uncharacterized protein n=1 Tax=Lactiplantibacillus plajomi TaxID=1457217 RepID=A0ABV6K393_9LACO|nr:hypothetical protein [Lactiplantibacillus plajomi]
MKVLPPAIVGFRQPLVVFILPSMRTKWTSLEVIRHWAYAESE